MLQARLVAAFAALAIPVALVEGFGPAAFGGSLRLRSSSRGSSSIGGGRAADSISNPHRLYSTRSDRVDELLKLVDGTDGGANVKPEQQNEIHDLIEGLMDDPESKSRDWVSDATVFDNYVVAYASSGKDRPKNSGSPAGGRFRGFLGRAIFRTTGLYQHIVRPNDVVNMVQFKLLSVIKGCVTLTGTFEPRPGPNGESNFVKATFRRPRIIFGKTVIEVGPESSVLLSVGYMDEKLRLGKGGQGSLFVFTRGGDANSEAAAEWKEHVVAKPLSGRKTGLALTALGCLAAYQSSKWWWGLPFLVVGLPLGFGNGGMVGKQDPNNAPMSAPTTVPPPSSSVEAAAAATSA